MSRKPTTTTTTPKPTAAAVVAAKKFQTAVYLDESTRARLGRYILDKHSGAMHVRNAVILRAIDALLKSEGY